MKIAVFSTENLDVSKAIDDLITKYSEQSPEVHFPVKAGQDDFYQSVIRKCLENRVKITAYFKNADGLDHLLKQADDIVICDDPIQEVLQQLTTKDTVGIVWSDSMEDHMVLHTIEDLAIDAWDITDGIDPIEMDDPLFGLDTNDLHNAMHKAMEAFAEVMAAYIASTVMESLSQAVMEHLVQELNKKNIFPFDGTE